MKRIYNKHHRVLLQSFILFICAIVFLIISYPIHAYADDEPEVVRVGYYENEVFQEGAKEGEVKNGYAYEYYRKLSEYTGWKYEYVYGEFGDLYQMLLDGEIDLLAGLAWREDRAGIIGYPNAVMGKESYYLVKHDEDSGITADPTTLNKCKIGVLDSAMVGTLNQYLEDNHIKAEVVTYSDYTQLFEAFDSHEVDILAAESDGAHGREHSEVLTVFGTSDYYLCINKKRPDLLAELNSSQSLLATEEPNYLNSLRAKYYSASVTAMAFSQAERDWMNHHTSLHVGYLENYLPYSDTDKQGNVTGIVKDIIPAILDGLGMKNINVTYSGYSNYNAMVADVSSGQIDVAFPVGGGLYYSEES
jgi:ABC-type amino acid transport substrate-binding protein